MDIINDNDGNDGKKTASVQHDGLGRFNTRAHATSRLKYLKILWLNQRRLAVTDGVQMALLWTAAE